MTWVTPTWRGFGGRPGQREEARARAPVPSSVLTEPASMVTRRPPRRDAPARRP